MGGILDFLSQAGFMGWVIIITGVLSMALVAERAKQLYFAYGMDADAFMNKIQNLILAKKIDEAIVYCNQMDKKPMAKAFKTILEKADRDDETIFQSHDIAMAEAVPLYTKRLHYLSMLANVATQLGLLGTIYGLILSFQAVAQADPATKQQLLATGISVSLYTTALGLAVAIPVMVFYSFLFSRQNELLEQLQEKCGKLTEILTGSHVPTLNRANIFPDVPTKLNGSTGTTPPPSSTKVS
ncbi:MAG: MotA/TolQ/ExbB proton channel family protein [Bdellovibrionales bacterium]